MNTCQYDTCYSSGQRKHIKLHFVDDMVFISIQIAKRVLYSTDKKMFPGDHRDLKTKTVNADMWWQVKNKDLVEKINEINTQPDPAITFYYTGEDNNRILKDIKFTQKDEETKERELKEAEDSLDRFIKEQQDIYDNWC